MTDDKSTSEDLHWLVRPQTIRRLWFVFAGVLALTVIAGLFVSLPGHFKWDGEFWFFAAYGFGSCAAMVFGAKALGYLLKRPDNYYDD
ncbi:MAG: hypothetical protein OEQ29_07090 [Alphaproteobacteria bacterium]|nr:hypothetical protein [Alphaproteobacteria bacterium]